MNYLIAHRAADKTCVTDELIAGSSQQAADRARNIWPDHEVVAVFLLTDMEGEWK